MEQAYYDLIYDRENVTVQQKAVELAERLVVENKKRLEVGTLAPLDLQAGRGASRLEPGGAHRRQEHAGRSRRHSLNSSPRISMPAWADIAVVPSGTSPRPAVLRSARTVGAKGLPQRPELLQAKLDVEKQGIQLKFDRNQLFPELDVFGTYGYNGSGTEFSDALYDIQKTDRPFYTDGGKITLPLGNTTARNNYKVATR